MLEKLKMMFVLIPLSVTGCGHFSITNEPNLPPIDFCTTYPPNGIPSSEKASCTIEPRELLIDELNGVFLEKCLVIKIDDLPL